jgi:hypothetical protein
MIENHNNIIQFGVSCAPALLKLNDVINDVIVAKVAAFTSALLIHRQSSYWFRVFFTRNSTAKKS